MVDVIVLISVLMDTLAAKAAWRSFACHDGIRAKKQRAYIHALVLSDRTDPAQVLLPPTVSHSAH